MLIASESMYTDDSSIGAITKIPLQYNLIVSEKRKDFSFKSCLEKMSQSIFRDTSRIKINYSIIYSLNSPLGD